MSMCRLFAFFLCFGPPAVLAHQINGSVRFPNGQPTPGTIEILCPPPVNVLYVKPIDPQGGFSFFVQATGRCQLSIGGAQYQVYSSQNPVRYDLILDNNVLRRR